MSFAEQNPLGTKLEVKNLYSKGSCVKVVSYDLPNIPFQYLKSFVNFILQVVVLCSAAVSWPDWFRVHQTTVIAAMARGRISLGLYDGLGLFSTQEQTLNQICD